MAAEKGDLDDSVAAPETPAARLGANLQATGRAGGHDLHHRTLQRRGVTLLGHFRGSRHGLARFAPDLADTIAWADRRNGALMVRLRRVAAGRRMPPPDVANHEPFDARAREAIELARLGAVVFAGGFRPDHESWIHCPGAFDDLGFPIHGDGASTMATGLYFVGVHFPRTRKSSLLTGVGEDAASVAGKIARRLRGRAPVTVP